jgi:hypothetical protein
MGDISLKGKGKAYLLNQKTPTTRKKFEEGTPDPIKKIKEQAAQQRDLAKKQDRQEEKGIFGFFKKTKEKKSDNTYPEPQVKSNKTIKKQRLKELEAELGIKRKKEAKGGAIKKK